MCVLARGLKSSLGSGWVLVIGGVTFTPSAWVWSVLLPGFGWGGASLPVIVEKRSRVEPAGCAESSGFPDAGRLATAAQGVVTDLLGKGPLSPPLTFQRDLDAASAPSPLSSASAPGLLLSTCTDSRALCLMVTDADLTVNGMKCQATSREPTAASRAPPKARVFAASKQKKCRASEGALPSPVPEKGPPGE